MNKKTRNTIILVLIVLVVAGGTLLAQKAFQKPAVYAVVMSGEKEVLRMDLSKDASETVKCPEGYNIVTVEDGTVRVSESDCPNQTCVNQGKIHESYEVVVCLPHELVITIEEK